MFFKVLKINMCKMFASDAPAEISHAPEDAKEIAKKLIASGVCSIQCCNCYRLLGFNDPRQNLYHVTKSF